MSATEQFKTAYNASAATYNDYGSTPIGQLESQLIKIALGDCSGLTVLDLGGGTGLHAREAVELGALSVDVIDVSLEMLNVAQVLGQGPAHVEKLRYFEADVSKPLEHLSLRQEKYDVVMANWIFGCAPTLDVLEGMFANIAKYLKPGGKFVGVRDANVEELQAAFPKYGVSARNIEAIPGGIKYLVSIHTTPTTQFEASSMNITRSGSTAMYEQYGLRNVRVVPCEQAEVVKEEPDFWKDFLASPNLAVVQAVNSS
ncbi:hypothetical protein CLAFUW4_06026 [Fulvia fulva]|uniref:Methyltransferase domain-containing protein n=1 Tax=Passalora fulva TaxID=5499 RepID=A0A9Q8LIS1_PASFU|nr:uncharacterized protein CLAFUR5_06170 [Fulvia fulva]KAK4623836.1 hypothetical protein CLAFUR4_06031 [Fulvia fulva]KAK4625538.1 hypothetical protein CLAFUR0_06034 [Fulvia fulva]UJO18244.1 hypothetical protein CLAFUR5_06170 [Fulvia fulva]WPV14540.1 hypothetical protein CLAFUW4_06026 [Fulvia fulva]WPV30012.1 hypothetical protein CLAFUW7_06024 [Fulvia fulva]